jgi:hypothetical protein
MWLMPSHLFWPMFTKYLCHANLFGNKSVATRLFFDKPETDT